MERRDDVEKRTFEDFVLMKIKVLESASYTNDYSLALYILDGRD